MVSGDTLNTLGQNSLALGGNRAAEIIFHSRTKFSRLLLAVKVCQAAVVWANLGEARDRCGDWQSAVKLLNRSIATFKRAFGNQHPEVASGLGSLATVYKGRKKYRKARELYERALKIDQNLLGSDAVKTARRPKQSRGTCLSTASLEGIRELAGQSPFDQ